MCKTGLWFFPTGVTIATSCGSVSRANAREGVTIIPHVTRCEHNTSCDSVSAREGVTIIPHVTMCLGLMLGKV